MNCQTVHNKHINTIVTLTPVPTACADNGLRSSQINNNHIYNYYSNTIAVILLRLLHLDANS